MSAEEDLTRGRERHKLHLFAGMEVPGRVESSERLFKALGGSEALAKSFTDGTSLQLRLRPEDPFAKGVHGKWDEKPAIIVKAVKQTYRRADGTTFEQMSIIPVGISEKMAAFSGPVDFQFIPGLNDLGEQAISTPRPEDDIMSEEFLSAEPQANLSIPAVFAPNNASSRLSFEETVHTSTKEAQVHGTVIGFDEPTPDASRTPLEQTRELQYLQPVVDRLKSLFRDRPVWTSGAIIEELPNVKQWHIKIALRHVGYVFNAGPFRCTVVRFGYDPRTSPQAAQYQVLDFRLPKIADIKTQVPIKRQFAKSRFASSQPSMAAERPPTKLAADSSEGHKAYEYWGDSIPQQHQIFYMLCDIKEPTIRALVDTASVGEKCTATTGWFKEDVVAQARKIMARQVEALAVSCNISSQHDS